MAEKYEDEDIDLEEEEEEEEDEEDTRGATMKKIKAVIRNKPADAEEDGGEDDDEDEDLDDEEDENALDDDDLDALDDEDVFDDAIVKQNLPHFDELDDEDEEDDAMDENYLQKFDEGIQKNIIAEFHPELQSHNYNEIEIMTTVVRDENGVIIDPLHKTVPFMTRYEKARILGERAKQLNSGAEPFVQAEANMIDGYLIALKEFEEKKIPFIIKRPLPNGGCEYWKCKDLEVLL